MAIWRLHHCRLATTPKDRGCLQQAAGAAEILARGLVRGDRAEQFNLNIPRYIDSQQAEDIQDIEGHLRGGIPTADVDALERYWDVCPQLRRALFKDNRPGYLDLAVAKEAIKPTIYEHPEFVAFISSMNALFTKWRKKSAATLRGLQTGCHPKQVIADLSEDLLAHYSGKPLIDKYDVYQHLMDYWAETMQDDCYLIAADGWKAETFRILVENKQKKMVDKGWACDLVPKPFIVARYFAAEQEAITKQEAELESLTAQMTEMEEEHGGEDDTFAELDKVNKASVTAYLKKIENDPDVGTQNFASVAANVETQNFASLREWLTLYNRQADLKRDLKNTEAGLDALAYAAYPTLTEAEIKTLVVDDKWLAALDAAIHGVTQPPGVETQNFASLPVVTMST